MDETSGLFPLCFTDDLLKSIIYTECKHRKERNIKVTYHDQIFKLSVKKLGILIIVTSWMKHNLTNDSRPYGVTVLFVSGKVVPSQISPLSKVIHYCVGFDIVIRMLFVVLPLFLIRYFKGWILILGRPVRYL